MEDILPLIFEPDSRLHKSSETVDSIDDEVIFFSKKLLNTMKHHNGLGLAAVQVGDLRRIIAIDGTLIQKEPMVMINPEIVEISEEKKIYKEGCLSFGFIYPEIERPNMVKVKYVNIDGKEKSIVVSDNIMSSCIQHEIDHTKGVTFIDRLPSKLKRDFMMKRYLKFRNKRAHA